jgi:hypothetical protein
VSTPVMAFLLSFSTPIEIDYNLRVYRREVMKK